MNILHHKSWHVRTKANIERVRRDEENAANQEKARQQRIALAEQEARTAVLRDRAKRSRSQAVSAGNEAGDPSSVIQESRSEAKRSRSHAVSDQNEPGGPSSVIHEHHINFFSDLEEKGNSSASSRTNKDYEAEKKAEKEKYEKSIGLLTYLGQSSAEAQTTKPWYGQSRKRKREDDSNTSRNEKEDKKKDRLDPMHKMQEYVKKKKHKGDKAKNKDKHKHKHKHRKDEKRKPQAAHKTIEQLRAERLKREKAERIKAENVLTKLHGGQSEPSQPEVIMDDRKRGYNSQYNPELARKRRPREEYY